MSGARRCEVRQSNRLTTCLLPQCGRVFAVCGPCDRGRHYCSDSCSRGARRVKQCLAGARYQTTERGRRKHAERQAHRESRRVTHQCPRPTPEIPVIVHVDELSAPARIPSHPVQPPMLREALTHRHESLHRPAAGSAARTRSSSGRAPSQRPVANDEENTARGRPAPWAYPRSNLGPVDTDERARSPTSRAFCPPPMCEFAHGRAAQIPALSSDRQHGTVRLVFCALTGPQRWADHVQKFSNLWGDVLAA